MWTVSILGMFLFVRARDKPDRFNPVLRDNSDTPANRLSNIPEGDQQVLVVDFRVVKHHIQVFGDRLRSLR